MHRSGPRRRHLGDQPTRRRRSFSRIRACCRSRGLRGCSPMTASKVMIVDDEPQARRILRTALICQGFEVTGAQTGEEALDLLRHEAPDVILLDLMMPGIGGLATCGE